MQYVPVMAQVCDLLEVNVAKYKKSLHNPSVLELKTG